MPAILILYYSRHGATEKLARFIAKGVELGGCEAIIRTVPELTPHNESDNTNGRRQGPPFVTADDLAGCSGLALGSPTRFGGIAAPLKYFLDSTSDIWIKGLLIDKPACVFTSSSSMHGGQESTLLSMMVPLLHHGMLLCGLPYSEPKLHTTQTGGTPYGVSHVDNPAQSMLSDDEQTLCIAQGKRLAKFARCLKDLMLKDQ